MAELNFIFHRLKQFPLHNRQDEVSAVEQRRPRALFHQVVDFLHRQQRLDQGQQRESHEAQQRTADQAESAARDGIQLLKHREFEHNLQEIDHQMDDHLGYEKSERSDIDDYRNGYKNKQITTSYRGMEIEVPQDRKSTFEP